MGFVGECEIQLHDDDAGLESKRDNYFVPPHCYCVETLCAPCGAVHAWTLFDKSEYPNTNPEFSRYSIPNTRCETRLYMGCRVLHSAIVNGSWNVWKETT